MTTIAIVYHSGFGHTRVQAEAVRDGAASIARARLSTSISVDERTSARWSAVPRRRRRDRLRSRRPTWPVASAPFKAFLDATSGRWAEQRWNEQARRRVHELGRAERRQARHARSVRAARHAAQHGVGRARTAARQHHRSTGRPTTSTGSPVSSARWRSPTPTSAPTSLPPVRRSCAPPTTSAGGSPRPPRVGQPTRSSVPSPVRPHERSPTRVRTSSGGRCHRGATAAATSMGSTTVTPTAPRTIFHPGAVYATATEGALVRLSDGRVLRRSSPPASRRRREVRDARMRSSRSSSPVP